MPDGADPLKPRKSPRQRRSADTVAAILEAAARILEGVGFEAYTTNAIAGRAGVSIGSLYQYFPGKDAITRALIAREMKLLLADIDGIEALPSGRAGLKRLIGAAASNQLRRPTLARLLDVEEARLPADAEVEQLGRRMAQIFRHCLMSADLPDTARAPPAMGDLVAIIRGMVDAAGRRGEADATALTARIERAVFGYLAEQQPRLDRRVRSSPLPP